MLNFGGVHRLPNDEVSPKCSVRLPGFFRCLYDFGMLLYPTMHKEKQPVQVRSRIARPLD